MAQRIARITATQVVVHAKDGFVDRDAFGPSIFDKGWKWIIEIHTDDGLVGYGETPRLVGARQSPGKTVPSDSKMPRRPLPL